MMKRLSCLMLGLLLLSQQALAAPKQILFWHAMSGHIGQVLTSLVDDFNASQSRFHIVALYRGSYTETLVTTVASFRAKQHPAIVQISDVGTATMLNPPGAVVPYYKIMSPGSRKISHDILKTIRAYYSDADDQLLALPFNVSTPVLYINKQAFKKAGLDATKPPRTWLDMFRYSRRLLNAGVSCGFTSTWPGWILVENFAARHNLPFADNENGFEMLSAKLQFDHSFLVDNIDNLQQWQARHIFIYGGREDNATSLFTSGQCAMNLQSSGALPGLEKLAGFDLAVAQLPYSDDTHIRPHNTLLGGAALWVMNGFDRETYRGIDAFFKYLLQVKTQAKLHKQTGYLPITQASITELKRSGYFKNHPERQVALDSLTLKPANHFSHGIRLGNYNKLRIIIDEALEDIFAGKRTAKVALHTAVRKGNRLLARFQSNVT